MAPAQHGDAVLLDIDGTLIDSTYHHALAWFRAFRRVGITVPMWRSHRAVGMGGDKFVAHVAGEDVEREHGDRLRQGWKEEYERLRDEVPPLPGATDLVRGLHEQGYAVAFASSGPEDLSKHAVALLGVEDRLAALTTADDADESKPEPDILGATLERLAAQRAVLVGDTPWDVEAASRIGLRCVAVLTGGFSRAELEEAGAALVVAEPAELLDLDWQPYLAAPTRRPRR